MAFWLAATCPANAGRLFSDCGEQQQQSSNKKTVELAVSDLRHAYASSVLSTSLRRTRSVGSRGGGSSPASSQPLRRADTARASKRPREAVVGFSCGTSGDATSGMSARALRRGPDVGNVRKGFSVGLVW